MTQLLFPIQAFGTYLSEKITTSADTGTSLYTRKRDGQRAHYWSRWQRAPLGTIAIIVDRRPEHKLHALFSPAKNASISPLRRCSNFSTMTHNIDNLAGSRTRTETPSNQRCVKHNILFECDPHGGFCLSPTLKNHTLALQQLILNTERNAEYHSQSPTHERRRIY